LLATARDHVNPPPETLVNDCDDGCVGPSELKKATSNSLSALVDSRGDTNVDAGPEPRLTS
jgi:hypothetical protein